MDLFETLQYTKVFLKEKPYGEDLAIETSDGYDVSLFWCAPSINVGGYPILQIDKGDKTVFWHEGTENPDFWYKLACNAIQKLCN